MLALEKEEMRWAGLIERRRLNQCGKQNSCFLKVILGVRESNPPRSWVGSKGSSFEHLMVFCCEDIYIKIYWVELKLFNPV